MSQESIVFRRGYSEPSADWTRSTSITHLSQQHPLPTLPDNPPLRLSSLPAMDSPPFSNGGQPASYTSSLLPGSGEQTSSMSDFNAEMSPVMTLPSGPREQPESLTDSLRQAPVEPSPATQGDSPTESQQGLNTYVPVTTQLQPYHRQHQLQPRSQPNCWTPPSSLPEEHLLKLEYPTSFDDQAICGSNNSISNFSPGTTQSSPTASLRHFPDQVFNGNWSPVSYRASTPTSTDGYSSIASEPYISSGSFQEYSFGHVDQNLPVYQSTSCPSSPFDSLMGAGGHSFLVSNRTVSPMGRSDIDVTTLRVSEPPSLVGLHTNRSGGNDHDIPYAQLIHKALMSRPDYSMSLQDIYQWFKENTNKAAGRGKGWQNSIRHNLSMNQGFTKRDRKESIRGEDPYEPCPDSKRSTEWVLEDWAIKNGIQSTTRYRKGTSNRRAVPRSAPYYYNADGHIIRRGLSSSGTGRYSTNSMFHRAASTSSHAHLDRQPLVPGTYYVDGPHPQVLTPAPTEDSYHPLTGYPPQVVGDCSPSGYLLSNSFGYHAAPTPTVNTGAPDTGQMGYPEPEPNTNIGRDTGRSAVPGSASFTYGDGWSVNEAGY